MPGDSRLRKEVIDSAVREVLNKASERAKVESQIEPSAASHWLQDVAQRANSPQLVD